MGPEVSVRGLAIGRQRFQIGAHLVPDSVFLRGLCELSRRRLAVAECRLHGLDGNGSVNQLRISEGVRNRVGYGLRAHLDTADGR